MKPKKSKKYKSLSDYSKSSSNGIFEEFQLQAQKYKTKFNILEYILKKECTSYSFGKVPIEQKAYYCSICDKKKKNIICRYCHKFCHQKCRENLLGDPKLLKKKEKLCLLKFFCHCGAIAKHSVESNILSNKHKCAMIFIDQELGIRPNTCITHDMVICCICAVVCHKDCVITSDIEVESKNICNCISDFHSKLNEMALNFPIEQYKKLANVDIWPIQILNILFSGKIFNNMKEFFNKFLNNEIDFKKQNKTIVKKFADLLELFANTFHTQFKSYYYIEEITNMFQYKQLFQFLKKFEVFDDNSCIIKFRLLFIVLFIHLRKDYQVYKSLTSNDFVCNDPLMRLSLKKIYRANNLFTTSINEKYQIYNGDPLKNFALKEICNLITKGMKYISIEENQDEFEIGLKILCFMLKKLMFTKSDLILLIDSISHFHEKFYDYMMSGSNNIYSLIDIFYAIVELCFMLAVNYNDLVIEENLENKQTIFPDIFIIKNINPSQKLLTIIFKNCDIIAKHYDLLIKPEADKKSKEEKIREEKLRKNLLFMQQKILSKTTGINQKLPGNGGLFKNKILYIFNETLSLFSVINNSYQRQLEFITEDDMNNYDNFCKNLQDKNTFNLMNLFNGKSHSNILLNLKIVLEEEYFYLFTSSYLAMEKSMEKNLRNRILNACDEINKNMIQMADNEFKKIINTFLSKEQKLKEQYEEKEYLYLSKEEIIIRKILKDISVNINFAKNNFLLTEKGRELLVDNLIISQMDETLFKGLIFLTNIHYPNIISHELVRIYFHFLGLFLLTKRGVKYILLGKNIQNINKLLHRLRYEKNNKNVIESKGRTVYFNVNSIKVVIHYLCLISKLVKIYKIKALYQHKALPKIQKNLILHIKTFANFIDNEDGQIEFKQQLKEVLEIFNNFYEFYAYNEFEFLKYDIIEIFKNCPLKLLTPDLFQKWFDKDLVNDDINFKKRRKWDLAFYFQFFELISKNQFYVYNNDVYGKKCIDWLIDFFDIENLAEIMNNNNELFSYEQKTILMNAIRIYYTLDYLDQIDYLKKNQLITTEEYKYMIKNNIIKDKKILELFDEIKSSNKDKKEKKSYKITKTKSTSRNATKDKNQIKKTKIIKKINLNGKAMNKNMDYINELIFLINIYYREIERFPNIIINEPNIFIQNFIKEIIFAIHDLSNIIYYNNIVNKIIPYYYKLVISFLKKKPILLQVYKDAQDSKKIIDQEDYKELIEEKNLIDDYKYFIKKDIDIFDKKSLFKCAIKNIFEIYKITNINRDLKLEVYLKSYDLFNENNFPPFSLIEAKDYEYFYDINYDNEAQDLNINKKNKNKNYKKFDILRINLCELYKDITSLAFINVSSGKAMNHKNIDFAKKFVNMFKSYINSTESRNLTFYKTLLCIMNKLLLYDNEHIQTLVEELSYDKNFFKNLNRELNNHIVQCINSSKKYNLCTGCSRITDITKITIQFLQLLGEGLNITFHENILKGISKVKEKKLIETEEKDELIGNDNEMNEDDDKSDEIDFEIKDEIVDKAIDITVKRELNKRKINVPFVETNKTIYESMIYNLRLIFHLMNLNSPVEGELAFDKLCVLTSNIIDFLIEFIDTTKNLEYIIDYHIKSLFFGKEEENEILTGSKYFKKKGVYSILLMKIKEEDENDAKKYLSRKIMLSYIKMKYLQLLNAYLLLGNKQYFVNLMIKYKIGPFQLFEQIIYYMKELINHSVDKNYRKYKHLLIIGNVNSYVEELNDLYKFDEDFRTSLEMEIILKYKLLLTILEEFYKINVLKRYFKRKSNEDKANNNFDIEIQEDLDSSNESQEENIVEDLKDESNSNNSSPPNIEKYYANARHNFRSEANLIEEYNLEINGGNNYDFITNVPFFQNINETPYKFVKKKYKKMRKKKLEEEKKKQKLKKTKLDKENLNFNSKFVKAVYIFLEAHISKVEIKMGSNDESDDESNSDAEKNIKIISKEITKDLLNIKEDEEIQNIIEQNEEEDKSKKLKKRNDKDSSDNSNDNDNNITEESSEEDDENKGTNKISFFIRPHISFHLSNQSKDYFINNADRSSIFNKYSSLISFSDYCVFEMMYNMLYVNKSHIKKRLSQIELSKMQILNYLLIIIENISLVYHYYRSPDKGLEIYDVIDKSILNRIFYDIWVVLIVKLSFVGFALIVWFYCKFILVYQRNIIMHQNTNFIFRKLGKTNQNINQLTIVNYFANKGSLLDVMDLINKDLSVFTKIKVVLYDSLLANIEINIFFFSFILNLLFLMFGNPIILSIELLFIVGIYPSLLNIFRAFMVKFSSLLICLFFTYCIIYIYSWVSIFYLRNAIVFEDPLEYSSRTRLIEPFCHSSVQCLLMLISYGSRPVGGIGDILPVISFKNDFNIFVARVFFDMSFYILVLIIMGNVTMGLIVDSFGVLRDESYKQENDKNNKCFICQISRDGCLLKNINFDYHVKYEHNIWNYVDFLCYLHLYDVNNLTKIESFVWDKLIGKNYEWIPIEDNAGDDDESD